MVISDLVISDNEEGAGTAELQGAAQSQMTADLDLTGSEQNVLAVLADLRPRPVGRLAAETGTRPTTLTSVLDRLERKGLLVRELDLADRRSFRIVLTAAGRRTAGTVQAAVRELEQTALASVGPQDIAGFRAVARALTEVHR